MVKKFFNCVCILCMLNMLPSKLGAYNRQNSVHDIVSQICKKRFGELYRKSGMAASICVMDNCDIIYSAGFGYANRHNKKKVNAKTIFNIASISKTFTAVAVMILSEENKIDLNERVVTYLPEFKMADERYKDITIKMLLNHSSGLGDISDTDSGYAFNVEEGKFLLKTLRKAHLSFNPGYANVYCNSGYSLLQFIIEKISHKKFIDFINDKILIPLNLRNTWLSVGERNSNNIAQFYDKDTKVAYPNEIISDLAACGLSSTPTDLCLFGRSFCQKGAKLLSSKSLDIMLKTEYTPFSMCLENKANFGLGWDPIKRIKCQDNTQFTILTKNGLVAHYASVLTIVPEYGIVIAIAVTNNSDGLFDIESEILSNLLKYKKVKPVDLMKHENVSLDPKNCAGLYTDGYSMYNFSLSKRNHMLEVSNLDDQADKVTLKEVRPGYFKKVKSGFYNSTNDLYYFKDINKVKYFLVRKKKWGGSFPCFNQVSKNHCKCLSESIENMVWIRRNSKSYHQSQYVSNHIVFPRKYAGPRDT